MQVAQKISKVFIVDECSYKFYKYHYNHNGNEGNFKDEEIGYVLTDFNKNYKWFCSKKYFNDNYKIIK